MGWINTNAHEAGRRALRAGDVERFDTLAGAHPLQAEVLVPLVLWNLC